MNSVDPLTWSVLLMLAGFALVILEVFIPSGGILGFLAAAAVVSAIAIAFIQRSAAAGFTFALVAVVALPIVVMLALKYWPQTAMGQKFLLGLPTDEETLPDDEKRRQLKLLVGKIGKAKTLMLPSGAISIEGRTVDAVSQGMSIEPGQSVKVIEVRGNRVLVRPVDDEEQRLSRKSGDPLSQPIDELGLDPLDDPLA